MPAFEFGRRDIPQASGGTFFVLAEQPGPTDVSDLRDGREDMRVDGRSPGSAVRSDQRCTSAKFL
jgi:hypothetical protein